MEGNLVKMIKKKLLLVNFCYLEKKTIGLQKTCKDFLFGVKCVFFTKKFLPLFAIRKNGGKHNLVESWLF
jgi:hypothetical protein